MYVIHVVVHFILVPRRHFRMGKRKTKKHLMRERSGAHVHNTPAVRAGTLEKQRRKINLYWEESRGENDTDAGRWDMCEVTYTLTTLGRTKKTICAVSKIMFIFKLNYDLKNF